MSHSHAHIPLRVSVPFGFRLALIALAIALVCSAALAQTTSPAIDQSVTNSMPSAKPIARQELLRRIGNYEQAARKAGAEHAPHETLVNIYVNLGLLYESVGMTPNAEKSTRRAIELLKDGPQNQLAEEINRLALLHTGMGKMRESEREHLQALVICESIGDSGCMAVTWTHLASLYYKERQMKKSLEYAERAYHALAQLSELKASDRIAILQAMAFALCGNHQCSQAIPVMNDAVAQANSAYGEDSVSAGLDYFLLGYIYWRSKDTADAAKWMERGIDGMKADLGWGHPLYVHFVEQYARFLHETGQGEAALAAESEVHTMESVVDARTLTTRSGGPMSSAIRSTEW